MRQLLFVCTFVCNFAIFFNAPFAHAVDRIDLSIGNISRPSTTSPLINSFRAGLSWDTDYFKSEGNSVDRSVRIETSVGLNETEMGDVKDATIAPVLHYQFNKIYGRPFAEISAGPAYISRTLWAPYHDLSSRRLFADRIGVGYEFETVEVSLNFFHFSNAGLHKPNPGADMILVRTSFKL